MPMPEARAGQITVRRRRLRVINTKIMYLIDSAGCIGFIQIYNSRPVLLLKSVFFPPFISGIRIAFTGQSLYTKYKTIQVTKMKKAPVRIVKKNTLNANDAQVSASNHNVFSKSIAHKISDNVMNWVDELREKKTVETVRSFNLLAKVTR
jgi:hypothetical protein